MATSGKHLASSRECDMRTLQEALRDGWTYAGKMDFYLPYDMWRVHVVKEQGYVLVSGVAFAPKDFEQDA